MITCTEEDQGIRVDLFLTKHFPENSRSRWHKWLKGGYVQLNGQVASKKDLLKKDDQILISIPPPPQKKKSPLFKSLYEDEQILLIDKEAGQIVHPGAGNEDGTLLDALIEIYGPWPGSSRPYIVHRLDKETSGLLLIAKNPAIQEKLSLCFAKREIRKEYLAFCKGQPPSQKLEGFIARHSKKRYKMAIVSSDFPRARAMESFCEPLHSEGGYSLVKLSPSTGRTHQLRLQMQNIHCPILGDFLYGQQTKEFPRCSLHAWKLHLPPHLSLPQNFCSSLPSDLKMLSQSLFPSLDLDSFQKEELTSQ